MNTPEQIFKRWRETIGDELADKLSGNGSTLFGYPMTTAATSTPQPADTESVFDIVARFNAEQRARYGDPLESVTVNAREHVLASIPTVKTEGATGWPSGVRFYTSEAMPEGRGMLTTSCGCSWGEKQADGGDLMHMAKRHTVIIKFGDGE